MIYPRLSDERGQTKIDWLDSRHSFSFGEYYDPQFMGFRSLRVINEDWIAAGGGFPTHAHRDMEILTYVIEGSLSHKDSLGNGSTILPGEVQIMSAGTGIRHSEFSHPDMTTHLLQIWLLPQRANLPPRYDQQKFTFTENTLVPICAPDPAKAAVHIFQDAGIYTAKLKTGKTISHPLPNKRYGWVQMIRGSLDLNGTDLAPGDGAAIIEESQLTFVSKSDAEFLFFDLA